MLGAVDEGELGGRLAFTRQAGQLQDGDGSVGAEFYRVRLALPHPGPLLLDEVLAELAQDAAVGGNQRQRSRRSILLLLL